MTCGECALFVSPDPQYEPNSMGACRVMDAWLDKMKPRQPKPADYNKNYALLGGKIFMPNIPRECARFKVKS